MSTENPIRIYLAGPDVFRPNAKEYGASLCQICEDYGAEGLYPLDGDLPGGVVSAENIFIANRGMIDRADAVIANLDPFRGPSADAGTVWEIGYAKGKGKIVVGYTSEERLYSERAAECIQNQPEGWSIESFDLLDNLMISCSIDTLVRWPNEAILTAIDLVRNPLVAT